MSKAQFVRAKEHGSIAIIGHVDHGKTTLTAALSGVAYNQIDRAPEEKARGITINISNIEAETPRRHWTLIDCPGHRDFIKNMIAGAAQGDFALLMVSAEDGVAPQTREHLMLVKQTLTIKHVIVFVNKVDKVDPELVGMVKEEIIELIQSMNFPFAFDPEKDIIAGSALAAMEGKQKDGIEAIEKLRSRLDELALPERAVDKPFLMPIEAVYSVTGRGTVISGRVERGALKPGKEVEILTGKGIVKTVITSLEMYCKETDEVRAGDPPGLLARGLAKEAVERGDIVALPGTLRPSNRFVANVYVATKEEQARGKSFGVTYRPQFYIRTANITGKINRIMENNAAKDSANPGDIVQLEIELLRPTHVEIDDRFVIREGKNTVGSGTVIEVL